MTYSPALLHGNKHRRPHNALSQHAVTSNVTCSHPLVLCQAPQHTEFVTVLQAQAQRQCPPAAYSPACLSRMLACCPRACTMPTPHCAHLRSPEAAGLTRLLFASSAPHNNSDITLSGVECAGRSLQQQVLCVALGALQLHTPLTSSSRHITM